MTIEARSFTGEKSLEISSSRSKISSCFDYDPGLNDRDFAVTNLIIILSARRFDRRESSIYLIYFPAPSKLHPQPWQQAWRWAARPSRGPRGRRLCIELDTAGSTPGIAPSQAFADTVKLLARAISDPHDRYGRGGLWIATGHFCGPGSDVEACEAELWRD